MVKRVKIFCWSDERNWPLKRTESRGALFLFLFFFALYALTLRGMPSGGDAYAMYLVTESIVTDGDVFLPQQAGVPLIEGINGRPVSKFAVGQSLAELPAYRAGVKLLNWSKLPHREIFQYFITSFTAAALSATAMTLLYMLCCGLGYGARVAILVTALTGVFTMFWPHARLLFSEPLQALSLVGAVFSLHNFRRDGGIPAALAGGFFVGMACASKNVMIVTVPIFAIYFAGGLRKYGTAKKALSIVAFAMALGMWAGTLLAYNQLRFGEFFATGYMLPDNREGVYKFSVSLLTGLHGLLFSSGKGVFFYTPLLIPAVILFPAFLRRYRAEGLLIAALVGVLLVPFAKWGLWHGDYTWGPRFLAPLIPLAMLPIGELFMPGGALRRPVVKICFAALLALSLGVQILGVFVNYNEYIIISRHQVPFDITFNGDDPGRLDLRDNMVNLHYIPEFSPLAGHWWIMKHLIRDRALDRKEANSEMQKDFPWKSLAPYAVPQHPSGALMIDCWWYYFAKYYSKSSWWAGRLLVGLAALGLISLIGALGVMRGEENIMEGESHG